MVHVGRVRWIAEVLPQLAVVLCLQPCLAARAFDAFDSFDPAPKERETITWGDIWSEFDEILRRFEASWFLVSLLLLAVICWTATAGADSCLKNYLAGFAIVQPSTPEIS